MTSRKFELWKVFSDFLNGYWCGKGVGVSTRRINAPENRPEERAAETVPQGEEDRANSHTFGLPGVR